ncbi:uncharacterized protein LOC119673439 isoform X6 [Teleopsis dalmanni]|uniref:uncharacterized protein LOC119673439 isoform X6 n=1 Tax=Teleopsis dalmanni TaxID=139649 RepID=UPI0018CFBA6D|nr:uncharacterized protein LOC119673439 isoform X6 [Teleopsis dalmanni]
MDSMNNVHNEGGSYSFSAQNVSPCVKNSNKKWSISRLFLKKKEINSDSSSQEDEAGFKSIQKNNRTKNSKQKSNIKKTYDNRKCNELRLFQNSDISIMSLNSGKVIDQNNSKEPEYELFLPFETSPIDVNAAHLHKPLNHPDLRNSTTSLPPLFNKPLTNFSSNASQRQSSDGNTNIGALVVNVSNRRTRSARNERYYKRLSRDFENSTKKDERLFYTSVTKPKKSKEFFDNINFLPVDNTRQSGLNGNFDSQFENTYGLQNISPYVSYSKQTQGTNQLLNPIDTKRSISCDSQICSNVINKCLSLTPPTPPPRGTSRQIHVSKSMQILNNTRSRPQSYAFDENSRLCSSDIKEYKNTLIKSGKKYQSRSAHLLNTIPINSVAKNLEPVETVSKSRRFITRGNRSPLNRKSSPTVKMATDYTYDTLPVIDGTCTLSHNTVPNTSSIYYIADALPRSRKPIHVNNMMTINNDNLNKQIAQLVEVSNISNIAEKIVDQHNNTSENYNEKKNLFPNSCNCFKIKNNTVENTKLSLISGKQCECGNVTHIEQDKHSKPYKNHKNLVNLMTSNIQNSNDVYNENLYDRYVAERREKHKMPIYETYMRPHNNVNVYNKLQQSQLESSSNLEDAINELETIYKSLDFQETSKTSDNESFFNLKNNNFCQYDSYDEESPSGEPDPVLDDVAYRNMKIVNSKTVEVLPFGIPLKPIVQASKTDYLNIHSITNMKKREITNLPDIVKDDLAVRTLRKDNPLTNQMCIPPKCEQKGNRVIRTQSANNFALIKRDAAKPSGGDVKFYTEVTPAIKRSESAENMYKLNVTKEDCDLLHTLCNMKHKDCLLSATANVTVTAKHIQIPFHHPSQKGAISELPNKLFSSSDNPNKTMIAKDKTLSPQFPGTNNGNENLENSTTLSKKFKKLCNDNDTCFHNTHEKSLINSKEEIENVSSKTISNNLTPTPSEIVSKNIINLLKTDKECEDRKYDKTFLVEMSKPTTKCDLAVPNLLKNLDPIKSDKIEEISKRCMIDLIKLGNDVEVVGKNNVIIEPDIVRMNSISIFEKCQQNISPNKQIVEKDSQHICHSKNNNENALNSSVGASSMSSSSDCLVKSSSLSINLHQSSSITSFNPYSSSDYIKSSSSENPTLSTDAIKTFSTTSYDAKSSSTTPNITTNSNISHSPTPPLRFCEDKNLSNLSEVSNEGLLLSPEYNSTEELTTIFGIGQYLIRDVKSENSKLNENESGAADHGIAGNINCDNKIQQSQNPTVYKEHHPHFYNHTSAKYSTNERLQSKNLENIYDTLNENYKSVYKSPSILTETQQFPSIIKRNIYQETSLQNEFSHSVKNKTICNKVVDEKWDSSNLLVDQRKGDLINLTDNFSKHCNISSSNESKFEKLLHPNESVDYTNNSSSHQNTNTSNVRFSPARSRYLYRFANRKRIVRVRSESRPINFLYDIMYKENCLNYMSDEDSEVAYRFNKEDQTDINHFEKSNNLEYPNAQIKSICENNEIPLLNTSNKNDHNENVKLLYNSRTQMNKTVKDFCLKSSSLPPDLVSSECNTNTQSRGEIIKNKNNISICKNGQNNKCDLFKVKYDSFDKFKIKEIDTVNDKIASIKTVTNALLNCPQIFNNHITHTISKEYTNKEKLEDQSPDNLEKSTINSSGFQDSSLALSDLKSTSCNLLKLQGDQPHEANTVKSSISNPLPLVPSHSNRVSENLSSNKNLFSTRDIEKNCLNNVVFISKMSQTNKDLSEPSIMKVDSQKDSENNKHKELIESDAVEAGGIKRSNSVRERANMFQKLQEEIVLPKRTASQFSPSKLNISPKDDSSEPVTEISNKTDVDEETGADKKKLYNVNMRVMPTDLRFELKNKLKCLSQSAVPNLPKKQTDSASPNKDTVSLVRNLCNIHIPPMSNSLENEYSENTSEGESSGGREISKIIKTGTAVHKQKYGKSGCSFLKSKSQSAFPSTICKNASALDYNVSENHQPDFKNHESLTNICKNNVNISNHNSQSYRKGECSPTEVEQKLIFLTDKNCTSTLQRNSSINSHNYNCSKQVMGPDQCKISLSKSGSIADRLAALQKSGEDNWKKRITKPDEIEKNDSLSVDHLFPNRSISHSQTIPSCLDGVKVSDRLNKLKSSSQNWKNRIEQSDAEKFTIAGRLQNQATLCDDCNIIRRPDDIAKKCPMNIIRSTNQEFGLSKSQSMIITSNFKSTNLSEITRKAPRLECSLSLNEDEVCSVKFCDKFNCENEFKPERIKTNILNTTNTSERIFIPKLDDEETFKKFFGQIDVKASKTEIEISDFDNLRSTERLLTKRVIKGPKTRRGSRNPLKSLSTRSDILFEYIEVKRVIPEEELIGIKTPNYRHLNLTAEAIAGLQSVENFKSVNLKSVLLPLKQKWLPYNGVMLIHIKGRTHVQCRIVEPNYMSINIGDCFILIANNELYRYVGHFANVIEISRSKFICSYILEKKDLGCSANSAIELSDNKMNGIYWQRFWEVLGKPRDYEVRDSGCAKEDDIFEISLIETNRIYEYNNFVLKPIEKYWGCLPKVELLNPEKIIVFDFGSEMYIWNGKNAKSTDKCAALNLAEEYFKNGDVDYSQCYLSPLDYSQLAGWCNNKTYSRTIDSRNQWCILGKISQNMETILFKEKFCDWPEFSIEDLAKDYSTSSCSFVNSLDGELLYSSKDITEPNLVLENANLGRGNYYFEEETRRHFEINTKSVNKWKINEYNFDIEKPERYKHFYSAESYIIRWIYQISITVKELSGNISKRSNVGRNRCAYFCWQGAESTANEKGAAALLTVEMDMEKGSQLRITQGDEPTAFVRLFNIMFQHKGRKIELLLRRKNWRLYIVTGNMNEETVVKEVNCHYSQLRSRSSMLCLHGKSGDIFIWHGCKSLKHTREIAQNVASVIKDEKSEDFFETTQVIEIKVIEEGSENNEFKKAIDGECELYNYGSLLNSVNKTFNYTIRLFHFTSIDGIFNAHEISYPLRSNDFHSSYPFTQSQLYSVRQPSIFMIDDSDILWIWMGWWPSNYNQHSTDNEYTMNENRAGVNRFEIVEKRAALETAVSYWKAKFGDTETELHNVNGKVVWAGLEPIEFKSLFPDWTNRTDITEINIRDGRCEKDASIIDVLTQLSQKKYSLGTLLNRPLPEGVDPTQLEIYLSDKDFYDFVGISRTEFETMPLWKQNSIKKEKGLF